MLCDRGHVPPSLPRGIPPLILLALTVEDIVFIVLVHILNGVIQGVIQGEDVCLLVVTPCSEAFERRVEWFEFLRIPCNVLERYWEDRCLCLLCLLISAR